MNKFEYFAYQWLLRQGYKEEQIIYSPNFGVDFIIKKENGEKEYYEVKWSRDVDLDWEHKKLKPIIVFTEYQYSYCKRINPYIIVYQFSTITPQIVKKFSEIEEDCVIYLHREGAEFMFLSKTEEINGQYYLKIPENVIEQFKLKNNDWLFVRILG